MRGYSSNDSNMGLDNCINHFVHVMRSDFCFCFFTFPAFSLGSLSERVFAAVVVELVGPHVT